jgi:hypothetical protein
VQHAHLLNEFDDARLQLMTGLQAQMWDQQGTAVFAAMLLDRICFSIPEPEVIDALDVREVE